MDPRQDSSTPNDAPQPASAAPARTVPGPQAAQQGTDAASCSIDGQRNGEHDTVLPPQPVIRAQTRRPRFSLIWLLPLVAVLIALSMAVHNWLQTGPVISIHFQTAEGLVAGKSQVRYKEVVIGTVRAISLAERGDGVVVQVQLEGTAAKVANSGTRFWVVRPQLGLGGVTGLSTLLSGSYIGTDAGDYANPRQTEFTGLEQPPAVTRDSKGKRYYLMTNTLGSLGIGSPVFYRRVQVGRVTSYALAKDGKGLGVEIFIDQPYDAYVTPRTRFWNASGIDFSVGSDGVKVNTESLAAIVAGGVAFGEPPEPAVPVAAEQAARAQADTAPEGTRFQLYDNPKIAMTSRAEAPVVVRMRYDQSVRGLTIGAPVELGGKPIGEVLETSLDFDQERKNFFVWVDALLYPRQMGDAFLRLIEEAGAKSQDARSQDRAFIRYLVDHGYRAKLKTGNLLTGQLYVNIERVPKAPVFAGRYDVLPVPFPTVQGANMEQLQTQLSNIANRLEKVKFDEIGSDLQNSLKSASRALDTANRSLNNLTPEARVMLLNAQKALKSAESTMVAVQPAMGPGGVPDQANEALLEVRKAAQSLRSLTDYLKTHPDALLRGRSGSAPAPAPVPMNNAPQGGE
ncbi:intermembrane transport protein PqiB [Brachymonas denitrificans]|uniref:PqiB family protein n=1 Tax=Brachymonas denitrificans TaxID=28220 RepID=UPI00352ECF3B